MSFDPFGYDPRQQPPPGPLPTDVTGATPTPGPTTPSGAAPAGYPGVVGYPAGTVPQEAYVAMARESVALPAIFLIINSVVNFLMAGYLIANGVFGMAMPPDKLRAIYIQQDPAARRKQLAEMEEKGFSFNKLMRVVLYGFLGVGGVGLLVSLLGCIGGVRMFQLRSYSLVVFASLMTAIPGVSPSACCCLGEIIGLWSLFVLMQPHVRMFFR